VLTRFESKRDANVAEIEDRIEQVKVERSYRIVGMLEQHARMLEQDVAPKVREFLATWRRRVAWLDGGILMGAVILFLFLTVWRGYWDGLVLRLPYRDTIAANPWVGWVLTACVVLGAGAIHFWVRKWSAERVSKRFLETISERESVHPYARAFRRNSRWWRTLFRKEPAGWNKRKAARLKKVVDDANVYIQKLNDVYTSPSGKPIPPVEPAVPEMNEPAEPPAPAAPEAAEKKDV